MKKYALCLMFILGINAAVYCSQPAEAETTNYTALPSGEDMKSEMDRVQAKITSDPDAMKMMFNLVLDPQFQEIMKDPEIVNAVKSQDFKTLMQNEKFMGLMENRNLQAMRDKIDKQDN